MKRFERETKEEEKDGAFIETCKLKKEQEEKDKAEAAKYARTFENASYTEAKERQKEKKNRSRSQINRRVLAQISVNKLAQSFEGPSTFTLGEILAPAPSLPVGSNWSNDASSVSVSSDSSFAEDLSGSAASSDDSASDYLESPAESTQTAELEFKLIESVIPEGVIDFAPVIFNSNHITLTDEWFTSDLPAVVNAEFNDITSIPDGIS